MLRFQVPEAREVEAYLVRDPKTGKIMARTKEELEGIKPKGKAK